MRDIVPCYKCVRRRQGCHSECQEYLAWHAARREKTDELIKMREDERRADGLLIRGARRTMKKKGKK